MKSKAIRFLALCVVATCCLTACGESRNIGGIEYDTYGLLNSHDKKNDAVEYEAIWGNIILGVALGETVVAPIYFFGFSMFEPVQAKQSGGAKRTRGSIPKHKEHI